MMNVTLHETPRWRDVVLAQIRMLGLSLRPAALVVAAVLAIATAMIVGEIIGGGPGFDARETFPTAVIAFLYPFAVWRSEKRFGAAFLWTLPVERRSLALTKALAGFVWLMVALAVFLCWLLVLGMSAGASAAHTVARIPWTATVAMYLFGSALVLGLRHPLRWLIGAAGVMFLMGNLSDLLTQPNDGEWRYVPGARAFFSTVSDAAATWLTIPEPARRVISILIFVGAGFAALWAAACRHRDRRKP